MPLPRPRNSKKKPYNEYLRYSGIGLQVLAMAWLGHLADRFLELRFPLCTLLFAAAGIFAALYLLLKAVNRKKDDD